MTDLLQVKDLRVEFNTQAGIVTAVDGVSFRVRSGSTVALVGESGSGKSVTAQAIMGILPRIAHIAGGEILLADPSRHAAEVPKHIRDKRRRVVDLLTLHPESRGPRAIRGGGGRISMIFQEPMTSLSPLHSIGDQVGT